MDDAQVSLVTGASRGIGRAIAIKLAGEKHKLAIFGRDKEKIEQTVETIKKMGSEALPFIGDVADPMFVNEAVNQVLLSFGKVDNLINNAGIGIFKKFIDSSLEEFKKQIEVNVYGIYNFTKAVIDNMISNNSGTIINISSLAGKNGLAYGTMYSASKHAVMGFSKSLMHEVREFNIRVVTVCPGSVATEFISGTEIEPRNLEKVLSAEDIAEVVASIINLPMRATVSEIEIRPTNPK
ncbi:SDR family oxidoreductase [Melioribacteraceae bacterium 4301-Me]|uniref:SDR family oxidoreductase n=1 Tax=Pyranulibacter aquaticus TaxID=3163344 RepID=UPI003599B5D9